MQDVLNERTSFDMSGKYFDISTLKQSECTCVSESGLALRPIPISLPLRLAASRHVLLLSAAL